MKRKKGKSEKKIAKISPSLVYPVGIEGNLENRHDFTEKKIQTKNYNKKTIRGGGGGNPGPHL